MGNDITRLFEINDLVRVELTREFHPVCRGSESCLISAKEGDICCSSF